MKNRHFGKKIFAAEKVKINKQNNPIEALVSDANGEFETRLSFKKSAGLQADCSCDAHGFCAHIWALILHSEKNALLIEAAEGPHHLTYGLDSGYEIKDYSEWTESRIKSQCPDLPP